MNVTVPSPTPLAPPVMVSHDASLAAVHEQPVAALTVAVPDPPVAGIVCTVTVTAKVHVDGSVTPEAWFTVNVCPAMVTVPVRALPGFASACILTVPLPVALAAELIAIQLTALLAVHEQPFAVVTLRLRAPPPAGSDWLVGAISKRQDAAS
jgi:hypothetical protein